MKNIFLIRNSIHPFCTNFLLQYIKKFSLKYFGHYKYQILNHKYKILKIKYLIYLIVSPHFFQFNLWHFFMVLLRSKKSDRLPQLWQLKMRACKIINFAIVDILIPVKIYFFITNCLNWEKKTVRVILVLVKTVSRVWD